MPRGCSRELFLFFFFFFFARGTALLCNPQAAPLSFARSGFSGSLGEDALWPMRHEIAVGEGLDKYWFRNCHGCWLCDWPVYPANGRGMERSCPFLSDGGTCIFQHCPRYLRRKGMKAQPSKFFQDSMNPLKQIQLWNPSSCQEPSPLSFIRLCVDGYTVPPGGEKFSNASRTDILLLWGISVQCSD